MSSFNQKINQHANDETSQNLSAKLFNLKMNSSSYQGALDKLRSDIQVNRSEVFDKDRRLNDQED